MFENYKENHAAMLADEARTAWGIAAAHGVALVTIGGMIGNLDDPNFAIAAFKVPLVLSGLGLTFGVWAAQRHAVLRAYQLRIDVVMHQRDWLIDRAGTPPADPFAPLDLSGAKHVFGSEEAALQAYLTLMHDRIAADQKRDAETDKAWKETDAEREEIGREVGKERTLFIRLQSAAIGLGLAAAIALGFAAVSGIQPEKSKPPAPAVTAKILSSDGGQSAIPPLTSSTASVASPSPSLHPGSVGNTSFATPTPAPANPHVASQQIPDHDRR
ncbi:MULTISPECIES: hypothetical protein [unclassified Caulobacter]|uniref:hypothetical protein n=1 Tax=unclassified Caulobacter TaxID=2648921 RepID=UPI0006F1FFE6|nr:MULTISPECIES: hypothetical protein [unclassified Caulobacter]KQV55767.1 hypothetical protein ASC62_17705 [Caulobacter sp. Root342]KQV71060.1 hypothetical protein ASC70_05550 [Caulobacter sp. Root343]